MNPETREAFYKTDAVLDHQFHHPNHPLFLAAPTIQRFGTHCLNLLSLLPEPASLDVFGLAQPLLKLAGQVARSGPQPNLPLLADSPQFILARVANAEALLMMASSFRDHFLFQYTIVLFLFLSMLLWSLFAVIFRCLFFNLRRD